MTFKYQEFIDRLIAEGCIMPKLYNPNGMKAYRFVFAGNNAKNHKPILIQRPLRILPDNEKTSGYALSCFDDRQKARLRYSALCKSFKGTHKTIGDSLCGGVLENADGMVTKPDSHSGHFDLYESMSCDLSNSFKIVELLWKS